MGTPKPAKGTWAEGTARSNTWCREQSLGHGEDSPPSVTVLSDLAGRGGRQATTMPRSCPYPRSTPRETTYMQPSPFKCGLVEPAEAKAGREGSCNRAKSHRPAPCWRHRGTGGQLRRGRGAGQPSVPFQRSQGRPRWCPRCGKGRLRGCGLSGELQLSVYMCMCASMCELQVPRYAGCMSDTQVYMGLNTCSWVCKSRKDVH